MTRKKIAVVLVLLSVTAIVAGVFRRELKPIYINAMTICYSCIGLQ
jgi:hypothetical protein